MTPLFYIGLNIVTRGHKKAPKCQNIAVGPEDPPGNYQDPKPRVTKGEVHRIIMNYNKMFGADLCMHTCARVH